MGGGGRLGGGYAAGTSAAASGRLTNPIATSGPAKWTSQEPAGATHRPDKPPSCQRQNDTATTTVTADDSVAAAAAVVADIRRPARAVPVPLAIP